MNSILVEKIKLIKLYRRWIDGDDSIKEEALKLRELIKGRKTIKEEFVEEKIKIDPEKTKPILIKGEIKDGEVVKNYGLVKTEKGEELVDLKEEKKISFSSLLGEEIPKKEEIKEEKKIEEVINESAERVESIEDIIEEKEQIIEVKEDIVEPIEEIIEDKEKEKYIMKILNSKPRKVPEAPERVAKKIEMPEEEKKKIPEKHRSKFSTIINMISQIFKVLKR